MGDGNEQLRRFKKAAHDADADMTKEELARVIGGLAKPQAPNENTDDGQTTDESS